ncbi:MAG: hypothetical protein GXP56_09425 [Deltaproteobacteria bacterium]|nr:hypothetical protein [Deltaproteobacteria bacterium]
MTTRYIFKKAKKISHQFSRDDRAVVKALCCKIKTAQGELLQAAEKNMLKCIQICKGMCCKNLDIDSIFSQWDFIFILSLLPHLQDDMEKRLESHLFLFYADCPFLKDKDGPCMFPSGVKAQICIITFCGDDKFLKKSIKKVNYLFFKLSLLVFFLRMKSILDNLFSIFIQKQCK